MENGFGDEERRTVPETNPVNRAENENEERFRRRGWRTKEGDGTEDGFGNEDGGRRRVCGARGAPRKAL